MGIYVIVPQMFERVNDKLLLLRGRFAPGLRSSTSALGRADMPAYVQHHHIVDTPPVICPGCIGLLPMYVRDVEPHWNMAKIDFVFECSDCGAEVRQTVTKPAKWQ